MIVLVSVFAFFGCDSSSARKPVKKSQQEPGTSQKKDGQGEEAPPGTQEQVASAPCTQSDAANRMAKCIQAAVVELEPVVRANAPKFDAELSGELITAITHLKQQADLLGKMDLERPGVNAPPQYAALERILEVKQLVSVFTYMGAGGALQGEHKTAAELMAVKARVIEENVKWLLEKFPEPA